MIRKLPDTQRVALFAGSFNPFTVGHQSVVERALPLFDKIVIAIGYNERKSGFDAAELQARAEAISRLYEDEPRVVVERYSCLTADYARSIGASWLLRGVRSVKDFEYERDMAEVNRRIAGLETMLLFSLPEHGCISSSVVRELQHFGADVTEFIP